MIRPLWTMDDLLYNFVGHFIRKEYSTSSSATCLII